MKKVRNHVPVFALLWRRRGCLYLFWDILLGLNVVQDRRANYAVR